MTEIPGRSEYVTQLTTEELEMQSKVTETTAFTNEAFTQLMDWFEGSDPIGEELGKRFVQIKEQLNKDKELLASNTHNSISEVMNQSEVNAGEAELSNIFTLNRFTDQFTQQYEKIA